jgi:lysozyme
MKLSLLTFALVTSAVAFAGCSSGPENACTNSGQALTVCATGPVVKGVDVSVYQGTINWASVKGAGIDFAIARVSDGTGTLDTTFATNWKGMKANGLVRGVYQFFEPGEDPTQQANLLLAQVKADGGFVAGDLPPVMDIEVTGGVSDATMQAHMQTWLTVIEQAMGRKPMIYTSSSFAAHFGGKFTSYPMWVANWGVTCPSMPNGWTSWKFWQYADTGTVAGISGGVDHDEFNGSLTDLKAWANPAPPPTTDAGAPTDSGTTTDSGATHDASAPTSDASAPPVTTPDSGTTNPCAP